MSEIINLYEKIDQIFQMGGNALEGFKVITEDATKSLIINPIIEALGWDKFQDVIYQYSISSYTSHKVDYALRFSLNDDPIILMDAKVFKSNIFDQQYINQIKFYGQNVPSVKWLVLTNGTEWVLYDKNDLKQIFHFNLNKGVSNEWKYLSKNYVLEGALLEKANTIQTSNYSEEDIFEFFNIYYELGKYSHEELKYQLSKILKIKIIGMKKFVSYRDECYLYTEHGDVRIGKISAILNRSVTRKTIFEKTGKLISIIPSKLWDNVCQALVEICTVENSRPGLIEEGGSAVEVWLAEYLKESPPIEIGKDGRLIDALSGGCPFIRNGYIHVFSCCLREWLNINKVKRLSVQQLGTLLRNYGCKSKAVSLRDEKGWVVTRTTWRLLGPPNKDS